MPQFFSYNFVIPSPTTVYSQPSHPDLLKLQFNWRCTPTLTLVVKLPGLLRFQVVQTYSCLLSYWVGTVLALNAHISTNAFIHTMTAAFSFLTWHPQPQLQHQPTLPWAISIRSATLHYSVHLTTSELPWLSPNSQTYSNPAHFHCKVPDASLFAQMPQSIIICSDPFQDPQNHLSLRHLSIRWVFSAGKNVYNSIQIKMPVVSELKSCSSILLHPS